MNCVPGKILSNLPLKGVDENGRRQGGRGITSYTLPLNHFKENHLVTFFDISRQPGIGHVVA